MSPDANPLHSIRTFTQLVQYLRKELEWPIESDDFDELTFDYAPEELGIDAEIAVKIKEIKQLRPLTSKQPWGIFFVNFAPKQLPIVALRRILSTLVIKKRQSANQPHQAAWRLHDLLFISSYGESDHRDITFAHFAEEEGMGDLPTLRLLGWDDEDTKLKLDFVERQLKAKLKWPEDENNVDAWRATWSSAFRLRPREVIKTSQHLAVRLAELARSIRKRANNVLAVESAKGPLRKMHAAFKEALIHDLSTDDFADMYAQTIAYGLLTARISRPAGLVADNLADMVPVTNPFLKDMLETFLRIGGRKGKIDFDELGVNEVVQLLRDADMEAVLLDFDDRNPLEDPVIHFYELFLKEYDAKKRMQRGVFYTPRPVVSFIVRSVHEILQKEFGIEDGLADTVTWAEMAKRNKTLLVPQGVSPDQPFVQILDPATGTGTFLVEAIDVIHKTMEERWKKQGHMPLEFQNLWNRYVPEHLLPRLHGFELMMAPYAIAHMKIGLKLYETGYRFGSNQRAQIYLTNSLEPASDSKRQREFEEWAPALAHEAEAVNRIKRLHVFSVVIGNPPYAGLSANLTPEARSIVERYKYIDGKRIHEKGALQFEKNLQDDYVKFFAWSEERATSSGVGILSFISNNGFLETPTLRGMRWHFLASFSSLYFLDLHGSTKRPIEGDQNVFDIQQGVAISLLAKSSPLSCDTKVWRSDLVGNRQVKYTYLSKGSLRSINWSAIRPRMPFFQFLATDPDLQAEYSNYVSLPEAMPFYSSGTETGFDSLMVDFTKPELEAKIGRFLDPRRSDADISREFSVGEGTGRKLLELRKIFRSDFDANGSQYFKRGMYRVFDTRFYYFKKEYLKTNSLKVMRHLTGAKNVALVAFRQQSQDGFHHVFITNQLGDKNAVSLRTREINYYFPLALLSEGDSLRLQTEPVPNFSRSFLSMLSQAFGITRTEKGGLPLGVTSEDILYYAYALFHSPSYRIRYSAFLKIDFPRLPLTGDLKLFRALARLGSELVALHLLESPKLTEPLSSYIGQMNPEVEKPAYARRTVWLDKEQSCGFKGVPEAVWNFYIGGYQVCEKWLKDRKGRTLSKEDIAHYNKIVVALSETIRLMKKIDEVIDEHGGWPKAFVTAKQ